MTTAVTGATGHLGAHVIAELLERGVAPSDIVAVVRNAGKAADLAAKGVQVRVAELTYGSDPELCETKVREQMKLWDLLEAFVTLD